MQTDWPVYPTQGPVITGAMRVNAGHYPDGFPAAMWIEDGGIPGFLAWGILDLFWGITIMLAMAIAMLAAPEYANRFNPESAVPESP